MELFRQGQERKYPFIVLHLANAVELLLQDRLVDAGQSIYETTKPVPLPVLKIFDLLKKERIKIPERPFLEFLIEDSNAIHHRFERPELKTVYRYFDGVTGFIKRFLHDEYGLELADVLAEFGQTTEDIQLFGVLEGQGNIIAFLDALFELSPESATLQAFNFVEAKFVELSFLQATYFDPRAKKSFLRASQQSEEFTQLLEKLIQDKFLTRKLISRIDVLRSARNAAIFQPLDAPNKHLKASMSQIRTLKPYRLSNTRNSIRRKTLAPGTAGMQNNGNTSPHMSRKTRESALVSSKDFYCNVF